MQAFLSELAQFVHSVEDKPVSRLAHLGVGITASLNWDQKTMQIRTLKLLTSCLALTLGLLGNCANAAIVSNGDFETGNFSGWTQFGNTAFNAVDGNAPQAGSFGAFFGSVQSTSGIKQTLTTVANQLYNVDFWLQAEADVNGASTPNFFDFRWGGASVTSLTNSADFLYTHYTFALQATSGSTEISFTFQNDPAFWDLDSISVTEAGGTGGNVPEPGSLALVGLAGVVAGLVRRRRPAGIST